MCGCAGGSASTTGELTSYEDEHLDRGEALGLTSDLLRQEIERPRVGPMRDIVATIQPDQDDLVRADLDTSICVQGAPGTGKTAVGLHRAAYLLYTYPERLRRSGVLVVGPNRAFLHYIAQVLPALGEGGIEQTTVAELVRHVPVRATEDAAVATLKGDARMAEVLRRAVLESRRPTDRRRPHHQGHPALPRRRTPAPALRRRRAPRPTIRWSTARERLRQQLAEDVRRQREDAGGAPTDAETAGIARSPAVRRVRRRRVAGTRRAVPARTAVRRPRVPARCSAATLDDDERAALRLAAAPRSVRSARWTAGRRRAARRGRRAARRHRRLRPRRGRRGAGPLADAVPGGRPPVPARLADRARRPGPGHHALGARLVGDHPAHLGQPDAGVRPLTAGYRVPGEVLDGQPAAAAHRRRRAARDLRAGRRAP